jgi:hypothetical protein
LFDFYIVIDCHKVDIDSCQISSNEKSTF